MTPLPHRSEVRIAAGPVAHATLSSGGVPDLGTAPPLEFDGPGDAWSSEQLLLAAVEACFLLTFREIVLRPRVTLPAGEKPVRVRRALEKAERTCLVSASLKTPVRLEPEPAG